MPKHGETISILTACNDTIYTRNDGLKNTSEGIFTKAQGPASVDKADLHATTRMFATQYFLLCIYRNSGDEDDESRALYTSQHLHFIYNESASSKCMIDVL